MEIFFAFSSGNNTKQNFKIVLTSHLTLFSGIQSLFGQIL